MRAVVFVLHGERYPLGSSEASTLDSFLNVAGLATMRVRGKLRHVTERDEIEITDDDERIALLQALEAALGDVYRFTDGLPMLLEAARKPITQP
jgi:hypothetical protein